MAFSTMQVRYERAISDERDARYRLQREVDDRFNAERDRRYTEVKNAEEKALQIKEKADQKALDLAREIQSYKDERDNRLREQINTERGLYLTREEYNAAHDALIDKVETGFKPLVQFMTTQQGRSTGLQSSWGYLVAGVGLIATLLGIATAIIVLSRR